MNNILLTISCLFAIALSVQAQNSYRNYTDYQPEYRKWKDSYILDKIDYRPDATVFYFRFICDNANSGGAVFYPSTHKDAWYLKGKDVKHNFPMLAVKNVRKDGMIIKRKVTKEYISPPSSLTGYTIFSCEVHFGALDNEVEVADLIEGQGQEYNRRHFNCFQIKLKTWDDETLGTEEDSREAIAKFEKKTGKSTLTDLPPTPENKTQTRVNQSPPKKEPVYQPGSKLLTNKTELTCGEVLILSNINFQDNSTTFNGTIQARKTMDRLIVYLKENPSSSAIIYGHTDIHGDKEKNMDLSKARAYKIQRWLSMYGINPKRIECKWYGPEKPIHPEGSPANRRVEAYLTCP